MCFPTVNAKKPPIICLTFIFVFFLVELLARCTVADLTTSFVSQEHVVKGRSASIAKERLNQVYQDMAQYMHDPVIVGGFGDSGTRGVQQLLNMSGVDMGHAGSVNPNFDSLEFMKRRSTDDIAGQRFRTPHSLYNAGLESAHSLMYNGSHFSVTVWDEAIQFVYKMLIAHLKNAQHSHARMQRKQLHWGFKHPRTALLLPLFEGALGQRFRYIHVIRDPREVATGRNTRYFRHECKRIMLEHQCNETSVSDHIQFWGTLNLQVVSWAKQYLTREQFALIRIEDLVSGDIRCVQHVLSIAGAPAANHSITNLLQPFLEHKNKYFGGRWDRNGRHELIQMIENENVDNPKRLEKVHLALKTFGYAINSIGTNMECDQVFGNNLGII